uniref:Uncharacterized protein n=1 Tax=Paramoeba aestuarina TaxID=180227 RepID=A0A7S4KTV4_9EUKA|mmetsp:Transcript_2503/g.3877  ORF Transcript_2503/g.3877 Transcript_2503/m.3877 type:complete len:189 (+) Transcript_2503:128-694(+)
MCMENLVGADRSDSIDESLYELLRRVGLRDPGTVVRNVCTWRGVECIAEDIHKIWWTQVYPPFQADIAWLPKLLRTLYSYQVSFSYRPFDSRFLQKYSVSVRLIACSLVGEVVIECLPETLEVLCLNGNYLSGGLMIKKIPPKLQQIDVRYNNIDVAFVLEEVHTKDCLILIETQRDGKRSMVEVLHP